MNTKNIVLAVIIIAALIGLASLLVRGGEEVAGINDEITATTTGSTTTLASTGTMAIKVFFGNRINDPETLSCSKVYAAERRIPKTQAVARAALQGLFAGPTEDEKARGFITSLNPGVKIQTLSIDDGVAYVDLSKELEEGVGGSCRVSAIYAQVVETLKQFPSVSSVKLSVDGRSEDILQP